MNIKDLISLECQIYEKFQDTSELLPHNRNLLAITILVSKPYERNEEKNENMKNSQLQQFHIFGDTSVVHMYVQFCHGKIEFGIESHSC